ncbi:hypothetical protein [Flavobacterium sp. RSSB_23]|uniref:hypothetical protein n=1 Tax=Flavobacterium sp. RSSB_23 TaxID=3447668 RepID=UPI003F2E752C
MIKKSIILLLLISSFFACNKKTKPDKSVESNKENTSTKNQKIGKSFFDFDKVEHYYKNISENDATDLHLKEKLSQEDKELLDIVAYSNMNHTDSLEKFNFEKKIIKNSKLNSINAIFSEKLCDSGYAAACVPIYRDIFIFKKNEKVVGKAKVCFGCRLFYIEGTKQNTENFGQCGDFEKLLKLIR